MGTNLKETLVSVQVTNLRNQLLWTFGTVSKNIHSSENFKNMLIKLHEAGSSIVYSKQSIEMTEVITKE